MMSVELFESIIRQVAPLTEQVALHLLGEPLVHPRLGELLEICHREKVRVFFVTNGLLLREDKAQLLLHPAIRQVSFSLHSFHDNFGEQDPSAYLERIFTFTERAFEARPDLYVNYRLWNLEAPRGVGQKNQQLLARISERFGFTPNSASDVRLQKSKRIKNRLYLHFDTEFVWPSLQLPLLHERGTCKALSNHFGILADGTVVPCCLDHAGVIALGNVQTQTIDAILNSERAQRMLRGFREGQLHEELCQKCPYIERFA